MVVCSFAKWGAASFFGPALFDLDIALDLGVSLAFPGAFFVLAVGHSVCSQVVEVVAR
jgi:hypothetical protein